MAVDSEISLSTAKMAVYTISITDRYCSYHCTFLCYLSMAAISYGSVFRLEILDLKYLALK